MKKQFKDWSVIKLKNINMQIARIKRLQQQDFLIFPEHVKMRFEADLKLLQEEKKQLIEKLNHQ